MELFLEGEIKSNKSWIDDFLGNKYINSSKIVDVLKKDKGKSDLKLYINSAGGSVFAAIEIFNTIKRLYSDKKIEVEITGHAYSAATILMAAGDVVKMPKNALVMVHDPSMINLDYSLNINTVNLIKTQLTKCKECIVNTLLQKVNIDEKKISELMSKETYLTADECLKIGLIDEVIDKKVEIKKQNSEENDEKNITNRLEYIINGVTFDINSIKQPTIQNFINLDEEIINNKEENEMQEEIKYLLQNYKNLDTELLIKAIDEKYTTDKMDKEFGNLSVSKERERIKKLYSFENIIDKELLDSAIDEGLSVEKTVLKAVEEGKIMNKTVFENHKKGVENSKSNEILNVGQESVNNNEPTDYFDKLNGMSMEDVEKEYKNNLEKYYY